MFAYDSSPMFRRYRQRRGPYAMAAPSPVPSLIRSLVLVVLGLLILYFIGKWTLRLFGVGGNVQRTAVVMQVEDNSAVNVSLEGGLMQRAEDSLKLYEDDRIATGGNGHALLTFFDGTVGRIDVQSDVTIGESAETVEDSSFEISLAQGALWIKTPTLETYSGTIVRTIDTPRYSIQLSSDAEVVIEEDTLIVFSADGQGVEMMMNEIDDSVFIGEGQQITLPDGDIVGDPLRYRSAIEPLAAQRTFIQESRALDLTPTTPGGVVVADEEVLTVSAPTDKTVIAAPTVIVRGMVGERVSRVRVNGNDATINATDRSFSLELPLKEGESTDILIEALDARGIALVQESRTVSRGAQSIALPTITSPAKSGDTYRTQRTEFSITGTAPAGAQGIMVNDYVLQLFRPGNTTWSYLASTALGNLKDGTNIYDVYTLDAAGNKSEPVRITILLEAGTEGVVSSGGSTSAPAVIEESQLPQNAPLMPGTVTVTGPTPGTSHTATGSEFLLVGTTPSATASVWVNGYRLQLYQAGKTFWNYIASAQLNTLKPGTNVYRIVVRNAQNQILDKMEYTATYNP